MSTELWQSEPSASAGATARGHLDPQNPFDNPTENRDYRTDYRRILPQILVPGFQIPLRPERAERKAIRKRLNLAGFWMFLSFLAPQILFVVAQYLVLALMGVSLTKEGVALADTYINNSAILIGLNAILFAAINATTALLGCRCGRIRPASLFAADRLKASTMLRYVATGVGIQLLAGLIYLMVERLFAKGGTELYEVDLRYFSSQKALIVTLLYTCVLAPLTEELLYRGFLMKMLSTVSVRFGIVISALLFGFAHGNVSQFLLAFLLGLFLGKIDVRHNSIAPSILVHVGVNSFSMMISLSTELATTIPMMQIVMACLVGLYYVTAVFGILLWFWKERRRPLPYATPHQAMRGRIIWTSPWLLVTIAVQVLVILVPILRSM